ncbi:MAG: helix-turn-helix transcriptional regulator [Clostridia bacterium]|nr:helix-turn-helix transcriptional regulator [Clostridia bacterium]
MIINANVPHTFFYNLPLNNYMCIKAVPEMLYFANNSFFDIKYVMPFIENNLSGYRFFSADEIRNSELPQIFEEALGEWIDKKYGYEVSLKSLLIRIFLWSIRRSHETGRQDGELERENSIENIRLMQKAAEYISDNFSTANESEAACFVNMSYSHFSRLFKRIMGKSFTEYLTATRINAAERMLFETDMPVTEVALACGFATSSHFIDRFKKAKGVTPRQYRQKFSDR